MIVVEAAPLLLRGAGWTVVLFLGGAGLALVLAFLAGIGRTARRRSVRIVAGTYAELFRGVSLVVQLFWIFFALPAFGIRLSETTSAIVGLGLCFGAYGSEVVRSAILTVDRGQREAATALGLSPMKTMVFVVLPQAISIMLPPFGNLMIQLLKSTAVAALITIPELTFQASAINNNFGGGLGLFVVVLLCYYGLSKLILLVIRVLETRMAWPGLAVR